MSDATTGTGEVISHALTARAAVLARRVAAVVEQRAGAESGAASTVAFLRSWAAGSPAVGIATASTHPLPTLTRRLHLTAVEVDLLLLAGLAEEHEGLAAALRGCHPRSEPRPTVGLAALVVEPAMPDRAALRRLLHEGAATSTGALAVDGAGPFFERSLVLADGLWDALHGHDACPATLGRVEVGDPPPGLDGWLELPAVRRAAAALAAPEPVTLVLTTGDRAVATGRCAALARAAGTRVLAAEGAGNVRLLAAHAAARDAVPVVLVDADTDRPDLDATPGPVIVCAPAGAVRPGPWRPVLAVPVGPVGVADRRAAWRAALPDRPELAPALAARHPLDPAVTAQVALDVAACARLAPGPVEIAEVSAAIRARAGASLPAGVSLVVPRVDGTQLVLGPEQTAQLHDAVARLEHQSVVLDDWGMGTTARADRGVRLLFTGPPGTGKTLAAELLAARAGTDLLVVDVSRVVSKWIGETEKNLAAAFDVAERTQAVLLLDEADALFATRTEIADAHDRYANLETAYLLQRLDRFDGLAVLATNLRQNIDPAFVRRMDYVVEFPMPGTPDRALLWEQHLPAALRAPEVDLGLLAHVFPVPGGWIRNAVVVAAFAAAADGGRVGHDHLVAAMRREYAKASRPFPAEALRRPERPDGTAVRVIAAHAARLAAETGGADGYEEER